MTVPKKSYLTRKGISEIKPYIPGKPVEEVKRESGLTDVIKLASNENPLGPSPLAAKAIKAVLHEIHCYPDGECFELKKALSDFLDVPSDHLVFANGAEEIITLIAKAFINEEDPCVVPRDIYDPYETVVRIMGGAVRYSDLKEFRIDLQDMLQKIDDNTKVVFICNPVNPTGTIVTRKAFEKFLEKIPEKTLVVLDEAYFDFVSSKDYPDGIDYVRQGKNLIVLRTFSKVYGLGGLRIGYAVAEPELIFYLKQVKEPFNVNILAQVAAAAALKDLDHVKKTLDLITEEKDFFYKELNSMGVRFVPSEANFILIDVGMDSRVLFRRMLEKGIITRPGDIWNLPQFIRLTVGTREQNVRFLEAFREIRASCKP